MTDRHEQKRLDIIKTAFVQWSKDLYTDTNLTVIAECMGMTKPALFRYFPSKEDLYQAMLDTFAADMRYVFETLISQTNSRDLTNSLSNAIDIGIDFFIANRDKRYFTFFTSPMIKCRVTSRPEFVEFRNQLKDCLAKLYIQSKGEKLDDETKEMILLYIFYTAAAVYMYNKKYLYQISDGAITGQRLADTKQMIMHVLQNGFTTAAPDVSDKEGLADEDYEQIESAVINCGTVFDRNKLFEAITSVIARNGIANASMDMIAKEMGFNSKSSLYSHFPSREAMLQELFANESDMILNFVKANGLKYDNFNKDLYGCVAATFFYFTQDANVLRYFDWLHYQMIKESVNPGHGKMFGVFEEIAQRIGDKYGTLANTADGFPPLLPIVLFSTFIIRVIVAKNERNGGTTSPAEMRNMRLIFELYLNGIKN